MEKVVNVDIESKRLFSFRFSWKVRPQIIIYRPRKDNTVEMGILYILITLHFDFRFALLAILPAYTFLSFYAEYT